MSAAAMARSRAAAIVEAAIAAVQPERLVARRLTTVAGELRRDGVPFEPPLSLAGRGTVTVVGGGKAAAGMAAGLLAALANDVAAERFHGLVSVPQGSGRRLGGVEVRETRPVALNLPTPESVRATRDMLSLLASLRPSDLACAVVSGGGSALLAAPRDGVPLEEKVAVTRFLAAAGAGIRELNTVRRAASDVKGGGLARACGAGRLIVLVLADVVGDPLDAIASGPCLPVPDDAAEAIALLERSGAVAAGVAPRLAATLRQDIGRRDPGCTVSAAATGRWITPRGCRVEHVVLGTNATAVDAAAAAARQLGYAVDVRHAAVAAEDAAAVGRRLAREGLALAASAAVPRAIVEGGEAVVRLPAGHGLGGRNQQTVAAALAEAAAGGWPAGLVVASVGTDGEDGPTAAAGGIADAEVAARIGSLGLDVAAAVARCDAHPLLASAGGLVVTGPTGTNVADLRLVLAGP
ncbi:MAG: DUF4147 domain-containing protein [Planctomycetes bacterium]|nr:DUF4147 domain-containing protein [Planctomycetota bacterium]